MIIPLYGIISHTRSMTQSRIRGILAGFNRGIKRPINLSAFTAHIRLNMDGLKYLVFHPSRVSPCLGSWAFQWNIPLPGNSHSFFYPLFLSFWFFIHYLKEFCGFRLLFFQSFFHFIFFDVIDKLLNLIISKGVDI